jgi:hypothetical protein
LNVNRTYYFDPEDGGDMFLRNVGWHSTDYTALYPRRWYSSKYFNFIMHSFCDVREMNAWYGGRSCLWSCLYILSLNSVSMLLLNLKLGRYTETWWARFILIHYSPIALRNLRFSTVIFR